MVKKFIEIPKTKTFGNKQYRLLKAFVTKPVAEALAKRMRKEGKLARVWRHAGELHFFASYHVYIKGK